MEFAAEIVKSGRELHPDDAEPDLKWELAIRWLYDRVQTQWRTGRTGGATGLDYNPVIRMCKELHWSVVVTLELLQVVEISYLEAQRERRESGQD